MTAARQGADGVGLPTTVAELVPPVPPPDPAPTAQAPRATTTAPLRAASTTSTTAAGAVPAGVMLTVQNGHPMAVFVKVNDRTFTTAQ